MRRNGLKGVRPAVSIGCDCEFRTPARNYWRENGPTIADRLATVANRKM